MNMARNRKHSTRAIHIAVPSSCQKPNTAASSATTRNMMAQRNIRHPFR